MQRFTASLDSTAKMITVIVCIVLIIPFITIGQYYYATHDYRLLIAPILLILVFTYLALWRPTAYALDGAGLHIYRGLGEKLFPAALLGEAKRMTREDTGRGMRTFGSGGAFGYLGMFYYTGTGNVKMFVTSRDHMILIGLSDGKKIMLSPDDPDGFLAAFNSLKS